MNIVLIVAGLPIVLGGLWGVVYSACAYLKSYHRTPVEAIWWSMCGGLSLLVALAGATICYLGGKP